MSITKAYLVLKVATALLPLPAPFCRGLPGACGDSQSPLLAADEKGLLILDPAEPIAALPCL